ncbi:MAG: hypothetical protein ABR95_11140 [Sphingobacteriales bacterium BACL12 MAG-120813-bin55]|nr:MAG: hypothetical protein ABR95_11140 [Sphingobacteriales bacterium BACL12 MAG-120813-bin55]
MSTGWYRKWFNAPYYNLLYAHRDDMEAGAFLSGLLDAWDCRESADILDMACGNGRHAAALSEMGHWVTGIDLSGARVREALNRQLEQAEFYIHDIRTPFRVRYYDWVLNLYTSMGYTHSEQDNLNVIKSAALALKPGGRLVIDFLNPYQVRKNLNDFEVQTIDNIVFRITRELTDNSIEKVIVVEDGIQTFTFKESVQLLEPEDFLRYFSQTGLSLRTIYGNYQLEPFDPHTAERMILVAQKSHVS